MTETPDPVSAAVGSLSALVAAFDGESPLPAGGAVAVAMLEVAISLGRKTVRRSRGDAETKSRLSSLEDLIRRVHLEFELDCRAFGAVLAALRLPPEDPERGATLRASWMAATARPVRVATLAREAEESLIRCSDSVKKSMRGDLVAALIMVVASGRIAAANAYENSSQLADADAKAVLGPLDSMPDHFVQRPQG